MQNANNIPDVTKVKVNKCMCQSKKMCFESQLQFVLRVRSQNRMYIHNLLIKLDRKIKGIKFNVLT